MSELITALRSELIGLGFACGQLTRHSGHYKFELGRKVRHGPKPTVWGFDDDPTEIVIGFVGGLRYEQQITFDMNEPDSIQRLVDVLDECAERERR